MRAARRIYADAGKSWNQSLTAGKSGGLNHAKTHYRP
jgi:hypothetical protein